MKDVEAWQVTDAYDLTLRINLKAAVFSDLLAKQPVTHGSIAVDPATRIGDVNPLFIGYNLEDLSYEILPGLFAQMLYGESFEDEPDVDLPNGWGAHLEPPNDETPTDPGLRRKWRVAWSFEDGAVTLVGSHQRRSYTNRISMANGMVECDMLQPGTERNYWGASASTRPRRQEGDDRARPDRQRCG